MGDILFYVGSKNSYREEFVWSSGTNLNDTATVCIDNDVKEGVIYRVKLVASSPKTRWKFSFMEFIGQVTAEEAKGDKCADTIKILWEDTRSDAEKKQAASKKSGHKVINPLDC